MLLVQTLEQNEILRWTRSFGQRTLEISYGGGGEWEN